MGGEGEKRWRERGEEGEMRRERAGKTEKWKMEVDGWIGEGEERGREKK